ncbi:MAG TPA: helix-turn-helix transcriptional regulator [Novosphingobium sp.]|nr:helix-turn-helix transcriptional regulator [Novosphingobium sp.]
MSKLGRKIIARNVRALRAAKGMSQEDVAGAVQMDRSYLSQIENGHYSISIDTVEKLADLFGVPLHEMLHPDTAAKVEAASADKAART